MLRLTPRLPFTILLTVLLLTACAQAAARQSQPAASPTRSASTQAIRQPATSAPQPGPTLAEPGPAPSPTAAEQACAPQPLQELSLDTPLLARPLRASVYLPPCYDQEPDRRYPVLYLLHGQTYDQTQWPRLGAMDTADRLIAAGELPPFLMIFPTDPDWRQPDETGFDEALVELLVPAVDAAYRTLPEPRCRAVGGLSRGAGWAVHFGLTRPDLFGALGAHSLPLFWTDEPQVPAWLDAIPADQMPRIYIDVGRSDQQTLTAQEFADLLDERAIPHTWRLNPGAHDEAYWSAHVEEYLRFYAEGWMN